MLLCTDVYFENYDKDTYTLPKNRVFNVTAHDSYVINVIWKFQKLVNEQFHVLQQVYTQFLVQWAVSLEV
jgi:hypothetical protein